MSLNALSCVKLWCEGIGLHKNSKQKTQAYVATYSEGSWHSMHDLGSYRSATNVNLLEAISRTGVISQG
jgi:hypothetical protein